ncbi:MAG: hypothetical protein KGZ37_00760 [Nitrosarchaeum sp.]|nr:hypothetical protein [Nitrosarchaeum sp.]
MAKKVRKKLKRNIKRLKENYKRYKPIAKTITTLAKDATKLYADFQKGGDPATLAADIKKGIDDYKKLRKTIRDNKKRKTRTRSRNR